MSKKKKWSALEKFEIALLSIKGETTLSEICKRYTVAPSQVHTWKKQLMEQGANVFTATGKGKGQSRATDVERQQNQLYEKIGRLTVERDFLKKSWEKLPGNGGDS
jgi:transposase